MKNEFSVIKTTEYNGGNLISEAYEIKYRSASIFVCYREELDRMLLAINQAIQDKKEENKNGSN